MASQAQTAQADGAKARPGISIFRGADGPPLSAVPIMANISSPEVRANVARAADAGLYEGFDAKCVFHSSEPNGFSLVHNWFRSNSGAPPHTHNADCLYYVLSGSVSMGDVTLATGDGFFVPANTVYSFVAGPDGVTFLEFRASSDFDVNIREAPPRAWDRMIETVQANRETWRTEQPPVANPV